MRLSISNIGWESKDDSLVYDLMKKHGFAGLEIAPTRIFPDAPYDRNTEAEVWREELERDYGFAVSSMQSIWYGRKENIFGTVEERQILVDYTKKAIDFAATIHCNNLVFGCPRNRNMPVNADASSAVSFFKELGDYAAEHGTTIGMEANPSIYNTNYINDTCSALELIEEVESEGFLLNLDIGTMVQNNEDITGLAGKVHLINHVHISEPGLKPVQDRKLHAELKQLLEEENYNGFISLEMVKTDDISILEDRMEYLKANF